MTSKKDPRRDTKKYPTHYTMKFPNDVTDEEQAKIKKVILKILKNDFEGEKMPSFSSLVKTEKDEEFLIYKFDVYATISKHKLLKYIFDLGEDLEEINFRARVGKREMINYDYLDGKIKTIEPFKTGEDEERSLTVLYKL